MDKSLIYMDKSLVYMDKSSNNLIWRVWRKFVETDGDFWKALEDTADFPFAPLPLPSLFAV